MVLSRKLVNYQLHLVIGCTREGLKSEFFRPADTVHIIFLLLDKVCNSNPSKLFVRNDGNPNP
jgi:hypothetical protein